MWLCRGNKAPSIAVLQFPGMASLSSVSNMVLVLTVLFVLAKLQSGYGVGTIDIGVIYRPEDESVVKTLQQSVDHLTKTFLDDSRTELQKVNVNAMMATTSKELLTYDNLSNMSCAVAIFDVSFGDHASYAFAEVLGIPLLIFQPVVQDLSHEFAYSARPSFETYARAIVDVVTYCVGAHQKVKKHVAILFEDFPLAKTSKQRRYNWRAGNNCAIVSRSGTFEFVQGHVTKNQPIPVLVLMNESLDKYARVAAKVSSIARKKNRFRVDTIPELKLNQKDEFQSAMEVLLQSQSHYVLVVCRPEKLSFIVEKAMNLGAVNDKSRWFALDLDVKGNISSPGLKGLVGLQISLTDPEKVRKVQQKCGDNSEKTGIIPVLANDTLYAVVEAFKLKVKGGWNHRSKNCFQSGIEPATSGRDLIKHLVTVELPGRTGLVEFDRTTKSRLVEQLDIVNVKELDCNPPESIIANVGHWSASNERNEGNSVQFNSLDVIDWNGEFWEELKCLYRKKRSKKGTVMAFQGRHLVVSTILDAPFCMEKKNLSGDQPQYEGFTIDLIDELKKEMGFDYTLKIHNGNYGTKDENGLWTGLVGELVNRDAHVAIGAITISAIREMDIDFSKPFMDFKVSMLMMKPAKDDVKLFSFLLPFETNVWLSTIAVVGGVTLLMFCLDYFSPSGYRTTAAKTGEGDGKELNLFNSLWFAAGSILQQGADNTPRTASGRMLAGSFWFFTLILISTYTANLAAYFTAKNVKSTINSLEDLANQKEIGYGVLDGGSLYTFFSKSEVSTYSRMFNTMKNSRSFVDSTKVGVDKVRKGRFAYLTDGPYLDYYNRREPCNTMMLENLLEAKSYGIGLQRNSELTNDFSVTILKLREEGVVDRLRKKWWDDRSECPDPADGAVGSTQSITLDHMAGVFIVLSGGIIVSVAFLLVERRCSNLMEIITRGGSLTSVKEQMDQPTAKRGFDVESKAINNIDHIKNLDAGDSGQARASLRVPSRRFESRLPDAYANAPESNL